MQYDTVDAAIALALAQRLQLNLAVAWLIGRVLLNCRSGDCSVAVQ
ncbi:MAG: hypothetical protein HC838_09920 [Spirulinaceae cyanobacterium RM2_2_10]|nr:hypothetical protein [Spirulinaceae cyanobacterium SM2_1_0]NJO20287.1 hypothetical protein [Spirulinaceae cyanobacterium RM2_2_10]